MQTESNFFHDFQGGAVGPNRIFPLNSSLRGVQFIISDRVWLYLKCEPENVTNQLLPSTLMCLKESSKPSPLGLAKFEGFHIKIMFINEC